MNLAQVKRELRELRDMLRDMPPERRCCAAGITPERFRLEQDHDRAGTAPPPLICTRTGGLLCEVARAAQDRTGQRLDSMRRRLEGIIDDAY